MRRLKIAAALMSAVMLAPFSLRSQNPPVGSTNPPTSPDYTIRVNGPVKWFRSEVPSVSIQVDSVHVKGDVAYFYLNLHNRSSKAVTAWVFSELRGDGQSSTTGSGSNGQAIAPGATFRDIFVVISIPPEWGGPVREVVLKGIRFADGSIEGIGVPDPSR